MGRNGLRRYIGKKSALLQIVLASVLAGAVPSNTQAGISSGEFTASTEMREAQDNTDGILTPQEEGAKENGSGSNWREKNNGFYYYENKKALTGLCEINGKFYLFNKKGMQQNGWQKYKDDYYFFHTANGKKGYMAVSEKVNGIRLAKDGKAVLTAESRTKLDVLIKANEIVQKATKPAMDKAEKLRKSFDYLLSHYKYRGSPDFESSSRWEQEYAMAMFKEGHGNCYAYGAAFAFLANAVGYKECYAVSSGGHGWAEVNGRVYDPSWSLIDKRNSYFGVSFDLSGKGGRPNYKRARRYVAKI